MCETCGAFFASPVSRSAATAAKKPGREFSCHAVSGSRFGLLPGVRLAPPMHAQRQPSLILLDALGTLVALEPPAPRLRARARRALRAGRDRGAGGERDRRRDRATTGRISTRGATRLAWPACAAAAPRFCAALCPARPGSSPSGWSRRCSRRCASPPSPTSARRCSSPAPAGSGWSWSATGMSPCTPSCGRLGARAAARRDPHLGRGRCAQAGAGDVRAGA